ncbi:DUF554 domain-containing protein [Gudongella sp. SC589]|jgi:hypothetical protein|uniref:DUF554 domain-containing protein n=1 Tax=Gudongella sp. SC589 TaxID=3385990 RepID=UPI003904C1DC
MMGTIVNSIAVVAGALLGVFLRKGIKEQYTSTIMDGMALAVVIIGIMGAFEMNNLIVVLASIVVGGIIGEKLDLDKRLENLGTNMEKRFGKGDSDFSKGFIMASLVYCIGAMSILGALESGLTGNHETLYAKSVLDGVSAVIFASTFGIGVAFSAVAVFLYQGAITLLASSVKDFLTPEVINEMSSIGGILIMAIGINILGIKKIKIANMLPAIFIPIVYYSIVALF